MELSGAASLAVGGVLGLLLLFGATAVFTRDPGRRATAMSVLRLLLKHNALPWSRPAPREETTDAVDDGETDTAEFGTPEEEGLPPRGDD